MSTARDFRLPKMNTSQALGAGIAAGALALYVLTKRRSFYRAPSDDTPRVGSENDDIEIYGFQEMSDIVSSLSPYVAKVEAWMKFVGLPYTKKIGTPATAPKGQLPYIKHGDNVVADSTFIIKYLQRTYPDVDRPLSAEQEALSVMMTHYIEDSLYLGLFYHRWIQSTGWESIKELIMATVPGFGSLFVRYILGSRVRPNMMAKLKYQGLGKHSETDINMLIDEELAALSQMLGEKPYLLGEQPCIADAAAFGFLDNALASEGVSPDLRELIVQYSNLVAYTERIRTSYFDAEPRFEEAAEEAAED